MFKVGDKVRFTRHYINDAGILSTYARDKLGMKFGNIYTIEKYFQKAEDGAFLAGDKNYFPAFYPKESPMLFSAQCFDLVNSAETGIASEKKPHKCTCDFVKVVLTKGCICGGI